MIKAIRLIAKFDLCNPSSGATLNLCDSFCVIIRQFFTAEFVNKRAALEPATHQLASRRRALDTQCNQVRYPGARRKRLGHGHFHQALVQPMARPDATPRTLLVTSLRHENARRRMGTRAGAHHRKWVAAKRGTPKSNSPSHIVAVMSQSQSQPRRHTWQPDRSSPRSHQPVARGNLGHPERRHGLRSHGLDDTKATTWIQSPDAACPPSGVQKPEPKR